MRLTPFRQEQPHTCLPACSRIVLDYWSRQHTEAELAEICGSVPHWGTLPSNAVDGLERIGYRALWFENGSLERLIELLEDGWPVIVFLLAAGLPHGRSGIHAVVVGGVEGGDVLFADPTRGKELRLSVRDFTRSWSALGNQGMVVWLSESIYGDRK